MTTITDPSDGHPVVLSDRTTGIDLAPGSFASEGTNVNTAIVVIDR